MNEYRIRFINSADETDFDVVVERSEEAAIAAFRKARSMKEICRIEMVSEYVPPTKDQEREALEQIRAVLSDFDVSTGIGAAFYGCCPLAESNIETDYVDSLKDFYESAKWEADRLRRQMKELKLQLADAQRQG